MKISQEEAEHIFRTETAAAKDSLLNAKWVRKIEELSRLCANSVSKTHIAFLGTAMLAKAVDTRVDLFAVKPSHAGSNPNAYSARALSENVVVPLAAELGVSIGVTGRQPLNNQPYFRMTRLDDGTPVHSGGRAAFDYMVGLVRELQSLKTEREARDALRAFIAVRQRYQPTYTSHSGAGQIGFDRFVTAIEHLVGDDSEGGRRAQAVAAGLFDVFAGPERVESGRINDPSRKYPGDVCVAPAIADGSGGWEKAVEVRDKPVSASDVMIFVQKCLTMGVREAAVLMVSDRQQSLNGPTLVSWAEERGIGLTLFDTWRGFADQALFWSPQPKPTALNDAVRYIHERLVGVEASPAAVAMWQSLTGRR